VNTFVLSIIVHHIVLHLHCKYRKLFWHHRSVFQGMCLCGCILGISAETAGRQVGSGAALPGLKSTAHRKMLLRTGWGNARCVLPDSRILSGEDTLMPAAAAAPECQLNPKTA